MSAERELHWIDRPNGKYSKQAMESFMVFCILDTSISYEKCCQAFDALKKNGLINRRTLKQVNQRDIYIILKSTGYRWSNQKAKYLKEFSKNPINLLEASREDIVKNIKGVGMKLASMFLRNTRGYKYAVIDVHTDRWIETELRAFDQWRPNMSYEEKEKAFINFAEILGKTPMELDLEIWQKNRIGNRRGNTR